MQIYTKILIGMGVGAAVGLTLGPRSTLLEHDLYKVDRSDSVTLLANPDDPESALPVPKGVPLRMTVLETRTVQKRDKGGDEYDMPGMVRVSFRVTERIALLDSDEKLRKMFPDPRTGRPARIGDPIEGWLVIEHRELEGGDFLISPRPVSSLGDVINTALSPIGKAFMRLLRLVIVPLVFASLLVGVAGLGDVRKLGRLGARTLVIYLTTTAIAVSIGLGCAHLLSPGNHVDEKQREVLRAEYQGSADKKVEEAAGAPSMVDNILAIIPENPAQSLAGGDMLQIIFFVIIFGIALTMLKHERTDQVIQFFDVVQQAMIVIIRMVMAVAPIGVAALVADVIGQSGWTVLKALLVYAVTVLFGLALHVTVVYGTMVRVLARLPVTWFARQVRPAQLIAFSTSSSAATLPVTMECAEENLGISRPVASFVLPLGATVNMDGTALYQGVAAIFIAQVFGIDLSLGAQLGIVLTATAASIGAAAVPGAGMITLAMVLTTAGIPVTGVALILGVDRILDMFRTAVNITGDLAVSAVVAVREGETLRR
jgi:Na+/H+-dicarboxylate symporter